MGRFDFKRRIPDYLVGRTGIKYRIVETFSAPVIPANTYTDIESHFSTNNQTSPSRSAILTEMQHAFWCMLAPIFTLREYEASLDNNNRFPQVFTSPEKFIPADLIISSPELREDIHKVSRNNYNGTPVLVPLASRTRRSHSHSASEGSIGSTTLSFTDFVNWCFFPNVVYSAELKYINTDNEADRLVASGDSANALTFSRGNNRNILGNPAPPT